MICPYCKKEMEKGLIQSGEELSWSKGEKRHFFLNAGFYKDSIVLSKRSFSKGSAVTAFVCRDCQKVLIDYSDEYSDFNAR